MNASRATRFGRMGNPPGDEGAHRMADQGRPGDADRVHECHHVGGELVDRVAVGRTLRIAEAAQVNGVGVVRGRQKRQHAAEREPRVGSPVDEEQRLAAGVALLGVVQHGPVATAVVAKCSREAIGDAGPLQDRGSTGLR